MQLTDSPKIFTAEVPSNIAFIKYWGKKDSQRQWPANDSLSMTLRAAQTKTSAQKIDGVADEIALNGVTLSPDSSEARRIETHLALLRSVLGIDGFLRIDSTNTFPSACGIASSASGFGALTLAAVAAWTGSETLAELESLGFSRSQLASLARQGSGSACRSFWGGFVAWSQGDSPERQSTDQVFDEDHWPLADVIVIISDKEKSVSSRGGHAGAFSSPLMLPRLAGIGERLIAMRQAIAARDFPRVGELIEHEALEMHSVMLSASPPAPYLLPETASFLAWVRQRRATSEFPAYFTLDAGPNVHLICKPEDAASIVATIRSDWDQYRIITDQTGPGPALRVSRFNEVNL